MSLVREPPSGHRRSYCLPSRTRTVILILLIIMTLGVRFYPQPRPVTPSQYGIYGPVIGIDLGHAYTRAAIVKNGTIEMITDSRNVSDILTWESRWSFNNELRLEFPVMDRCGSLRCNFHKQTFSVDRMPELKSPPDVYFEQLQIAQTLHHVRLIASRYLSEPVTHAILTVPFATSDSSRDTLKHLAKSAGLTVLRVMNAPVAVGRAYGLDKSPGESKAVVVDVGADEMRVSVLSIDDGVFEILGETVEKNLGGDGYNLRVLNWLAEEGEFGGMGAKARSRVLEETERIKNLASKPCSLAEPRADENCLLKEVFENLTRELVLHSNEPIDQALFSAGVNVSSINRLILTGGSSNLPQLKSAVQSHLGRIPMIFKNGNKPEEAAVIGAAMQGGIISGQIETETMCTMRFSSVPLGIATSGGVFHQILPRNWYIPNRRSDAFGIPANGVAKIRAYAGMRRLSEDNVLLGELRIPRLEPGLNVTVTMYWDYDDAMGVAVRNSSGVIGQAVVSSPSNPRLSYDLVTEMFDEWDRTQEPGTRQAKKQLAKLRTYIKKSLKGLSVGSPVERQDSSKEIKLRDINTWIDQTVKPSLDQVDEWFGQARAVVMGRTDGLPVRLG